MLKLNNFDDLVYKYKILHIESYILKFIFIFGSIFCVYFTRVLLLLIFIYLFILTCVFNNRLKKCLLKNRHLMF